MKAAGQQLIERCKPELNFLKAENNSLKSLKNKLKEFLSNLPIPTTEKGGSGGAGDDGLITQLTNMINQHEDLKRNVSLKARQGRQYRERTEHAIAEVNFLKA